MSTYADDDLDADVCECDVVGCNARGVMWRDASNRARVPTDWGQWASFGYHGLGSLVLCPRHLIERKQGARVRVVLEDEA